MASSVPALSLGSEIYDAVTSPFQGLQSLVSTVAGTLDLHIAIQDASARACRESQALFQSKALQIFGANAGIYKSLWFLPLTDIVYWDWGIITAVDVPGSEFYNVQNVAVEWPGEIKTLVSDLLRDVQGLFPDCMRLMFVMPHKALPEPNIKFFKVQDYDGIDLDYEDDRYYCWEDIEQEICGLWPIFGSYSTPIMEAVEVAPVRDEVGRI
ncbi:hypothetical protein F53441_2528 [Fusarium austroafricanum]|uniref:Uncharacterized protein n=1 Tax=Fusarium austroafricanum TaxID=2364996 RepID=A0A8H4KST1_9HYPO|nr:hypothetical protein F53441_2528 [Fusarium austroafricanum]